MKQAYRDELPPAIASELENVRFARLEQNKFTFRVVANGDDPHEVNDASTDGDLYRIDDR